MSIIRAKIDTAFHDYKSKTFYWMNDFLALVTIVSIIAIVLETVPYLENYHYIFDSIEYATVAIFTLEYLARILVAKNKLKYVFSFFGIIDLLSILPTFLKIGNLTFLKSTRVLRILRFLRMIRLAKILRLKRKKRRDLEEHSQVYRLNIQIYFLALASAIVIFGSIIYILEGQYQEFSSIPLGMLWATKTILGGVFQEVPHTVLGNVTIIFARFVGLVLFGLLINVVGRGINKILFGTASIEYPKK